jgi:hypothetical protein
MKVRAHLCAAFSTNDEWPEPHRLRRRLGGVS